jgi:hypothetical protein
VLRRELERRDLLQLPRVFISPSCGSEVQRLREYVRRLQGQTVESPGEPAVLCHAVLSACLVPWGGTSDAKADCFRLVHAASHAPASLFLAVPSTYVHPPTHRFSPSPSLSLSHSSQMSKV